SITLAERGERDDSTGIAPSPLAPALASSRLLGSFPSPPGVGVIRCWAGCCPEVVHPRTIFPPSPYWQASGQAVFTTPIQAVRRPTRPCGGSRDRDAPTRFSHRDPCGEGGRRARGDDHT